MRGTASEISAVLGRTYEERVTGSTALAVRSLESTAEGLASGGRAELAKGAEQAATRGAA